MVSTGDSAGASPSHRPESGFLLPPGMADAEVSLLGLW